MIELIEFEGWRYVDETRISREYTAEEMECTCHERDSSYRCEACHREGENGHYEPVVNASELIDWLTGLEGVLMRQRWELVKALREPDDRYVLIASGISGAIAIAQAELDRERERAKPIGRITCGTCSGYGLIHSGGNTGEPEPTCPTCDGEGVVPLMSQPQEASE